MSAPLPNALRARFQQYIEEGLSGRAAAQAWSPQPASFVIVTGDHERDRKARRP